jgi:hypothetical protein
MTAGFRRFEPAEIERAATRFDVIAGDVALKRQGRELVGLCPFHAEKTPSFAVVAHKGFAHCQGCGWHGSAINYVMQRQHLGFVGAMRLLLNLPPRAPKQDRVPRPVSGSDRTSAADNIAAARAIWARSGPAGGYVSTYLTSRYLLTRRGFPEAIREHPALYCREREEQLPALVAAFHDSRDELTAVQRIWLEGQFEIDETGGDPKGARLKDIPKKSRGVLGDGAIRLGPVGPMLGFAEGVETALAASELYKLPVWALAGLSRLGYPAHWTEAGDGVPSRHVELRPPGVWVPPEVKHLIIYGDGNAIGRLVAEFAVDWWRWSWRRERVRRSVEVVFPDLGYGDFQEQLRTRVLAGAHR